MVPPVFREIVLPSLAAQLRISRLLHRNRRPRYLSLALNIRLRLGLHRRPRRRLRLSLFLLQEIHLFVLLDYPLLDVRERSHLGVGHLLRRRGARIVVLHDDRRAVVVIFGSL